MGYLRILLCPLWLYRHFAFWAMSHRHCLLRQCRNTALPSLAISILCLLGCFASWATLPLGLLCLLGYFASWATLPLGLLCLLGYFASWAALPLGLLCLPLGLLCLLGCFASWATLPPGLLCLLGCFASCATLPLGLFQHVATWAMSHRHCLLWQCRYTDMPLGLCHHWALVSMEKW
jgi:hypothetical protein